MQVQHLYKYSTRIYSSSNTAVGRETTLLNSGAYYKYIQQAELCQISVQGIQDAIVVFSLAVVHVLRTHHLVQGSMILSGQPTKMPNKLELESELVLFQFATDAIPRTMCIPACTTMHAASSSTTHTSY